MTIFVFENTNNMGTLRSNNVGYVVGMKGRRERQALCCAVDVPLNFNLYGQRLDQA
jgi:hypothetical protein